MSNLKFVTNTSGDWEAIYIDNILCYEEHSIHSFQWLHCLNSGVTGALEYKVTSDYMGEMDNYYPNDFNDIPKEAFV